jgi:hypothetical protein
MPILHCSIDGLYFSSVFSIAYRYAEGSVIAQQAFYVAVRH